MRKIFKTLLLASIFFSQNIYADFANGGFQDPFYSTTSNPNVGIPSWTSKGYLFTGYRAGLVLPPKSLDDIILVSSPKAPLGITDIFYNATSKSQTDHFLVEATPTPSLSLPEVETQTAIINLRSQNPGYAVSGTSSKPRGWATYGQQATSLSQKITIQNSDIIGGVAHIRFKIAAVMENPSHTAKQQPFYAIQVNNYTKGRYGSNPLYFQWSYANQPGVPWNTLSSKGTNSGSNATYQYLNWQNYDLTFNSSQISANDEVELIVLAAGCSPGGHDGHVYLDNVTTQSNLAGLLISATGPATTTPGSEITYTYTYRNNGVASASGVKIVAHMPVSQNSPVPYETIYNGCSGTGGTCSYDPTTNLLTFTLSSALGAGNSGTFTMTVGVPGDWPTSYGPINNGNFPISATGINPVLGNLVQTTMMPGTPTPNSNLVVDVSGLTNTSIQSGNTYTGTYSCTNTGAAMAPTATCNISNLPDGLSVTTCTINPGGSWTTPADIPSNSTVTCTVSGTATSPFSKEYDALVSSDSTNNTNSTTNHANVPFYIYNNPVSIPATLNGSTIISPAPVCCGRPVVMFDLPIESDLGATYTITGTTGNIRCVIGNTGVNNYVKIYGRPGTCTVQGLKNGEISLPLTFVAS